MYKNMYKLVTNGIASFSLLDADELEVELPELTIFKASKLKARLLVITFVVVV